MTDPRPVVRPVRVTYTTADGSVLHFNVKRDGSWECVDIDVSDEAEAHALAEAGVEA